MKTEAFKKILERYIKKEATQSEVELVETYLDKKADKNKTVPFNIEEVQHRLYGQIEASINKERKARPFHAIYIQWSIAASILVAVGAFFFSLVDVGPKVIQVSTNHGEKKEVRLPDGTVVTLNSGSSLSYPEQFKNDTREIALVGEAFFDVHRDTLKPFIIETGKLRTRVLGTSFNINAFQDSDSIRVSVVEGKVMVYDSMEVKEILQPNQQLKYNKRDKGYRTARYDSSMDRAWSSNVIYFNGTSLEEATKDVKQVIGLTRALNDGEETRFVVVLSKFVPGDNERLKLVLREVHGNRILEIVE